MEIPAQLARDLGATHVISVHLPAQSEAPAPRHVFEVVNRCFQILQERTEAQWRAASDLVITPDVRAVTWDGFESGKELVKAGALAAEAALPRIQALLPRRSPGQNGTGILRTAPIAALRRDAL
jgi:NTE family protein